MAITYNVIETKTLGSASSSVSFTSIPQTYTDLVILGSWRWAGASGNDIGIRFNGDSANNYYGQQFVSQNAASAANETSSVSSFRAVNNGSSAYDSAFEINIFNYTSSIPKGVYSRWFAPESSSSWGTFGGGWTSTAAITQIDLVKYDGSGTIAASSVFTLIGILRA